MPLMSWLIRTLGFFACELPVRLNYVVRQKRVLGDFIDQLRMVEQRRIYGDETASYGYLPPPSPEECVVPQK